MEAVRENPKDKVTKQSKPKQPVSTGRKDKVTNQVPTGRRTRAKDLGPLGTCSSREQWMKIIKQKGALTVPGDWWPGSSSEIKAQLFDCEITEVKFAKERYTFTIECVDKEVDPNPYPMLWADLQQYWMCDVPLQRYSPVVGS